VCGRTWLMELLRGARYMGLGPFAPTSGARSSLLLPLNILPPCRPGSSVCVLWLVGVVGGCSSGRRGGGVEW
jgi:hypothetical protein